MSVYLYIRDLQVALVPLIVHHHTLCHSSTASLMNNIIVREGEKDLFHTNCGKGAENL